MLVALAPLLATAGGADQAVRDAKDRIKAGDFLGAAAKFREAYAAEPKPDHICNAGVAYHRAGGHPSLAQLYLSQCLERGKNVMERAFLDQVAGVLAAVEDELKKGSFAPVDVAVTPLTATVSVSAFGADESFIGSRVIWLPWGQHTVTVRAEGYVETTTPVTVGSHDRVPMRVTLERKPATEPVTPDRPVTPTSTPTPSTPSEPLVVHRSKWPAIAATAGTVIAIATSVHAYQVAHDRADVAATAVEQGIFDADKRSVDRWNRVFAISGAIALAGVAGSGYLWYRALTPVQVEVAPAAGGGGAAVSVRGRF